MLADIVSAVEAGQVGALHAETQWTAIKAFSI